MRKATGHPRQNPKGCGCIDDKGEGPISNGSRTGHSVKSGGIRGSGPVLPGGYS